MWDNEKLDKMCHALCTCCHLQFLPKLCVYDCLSADQLCVQQSSGLDFAKGGGVCKHLLFVMLRVALWHQDAIGAVKGELSLS